MGKRCHIRRTSALPLYWTLFPCKTTQHPQRTLHRIEKTQPHCIANPRRQTHRKPAVGLLRIGKRLTRNLRPLRHFIRAKPIPHAPLPHHRPQRHRQRMIEIAGTRLPQPQSRAPMSPRPTGRRLCRFARAFLGLFACFHKDKTRAHAKSFTVPVSILEKTEVTRH